LIVYIFLSNILSNICVRLCTLWKNDFAKELCRSLKCPIILIVQQNYLQIYI